MSSIKLCVFDMDGLLLDSEKVYLHNALKTSEIYNYGLDWDFLVTTLGINEEATRQMFYQHLGRDFPFDLFLKQEWKLHLEYLAAHKLERKKGVDELLDYLERKGIKKAVATSSNQSFAEDYLRDTGLLERMDFVVYGDMLSESKPKPQIYLKAIEPFPFAKDEILAFEDSNNGILSAYNAGLKVIHVPDLAMVEESTREKCYAILDSIDEAIDIIENYQ